MWLWFLQHMAMVGVVSYGVYLIADGDLTMGGLIACVILTSRAMAPMSQVANLATRYHRAKGCFQDFKWDHGFTGRASFR